MNQLCKNLASRYTVKEIVIRRICRNATTLFNEYDLQSNLEVSAYIESGVMEIMQGCPNDYHGFDVANTGAVVSEVIKLLTEDSPDRLFDIYKDMVLSGNCWSVMIIGFAHRGKSSFIDALSKIFRTVQVYANVYEGMDAGNASIEKFEMGPVQIFDSVGVKEYELGDGDSIRSIADMLRSDDASSFHEIREDNMLFEPLLKKLKSGRETLLPQIYLYILHYEDILNSTICYKSWKKLHDLFNREYPYCKLLPIVTHQDEISYADLQKFKDKISLSAGGNQDQCFFVSNTSIMDSVDEWDGLLTMIKDNPYHVFSKPEISNVQILTATPGPKPTVELNSGEHDLQYGEAEPYPLNLAEQRLQWEFGDNQFVRISYLWGLREYIIHALPNETVHLRPLHLQFEDRFSLRRIYEHYNIQYVEPSTKSRRQRILDTMIWEEPQVEEHVPGFFQSHKKSILSLGIFGSALGLLMWSKVKGESSDTTTA